MGGADFGPGPCGMVFIRLRSCSDGLLSSGSTVEKVLQRLVLTLGDAAADAARVACGARAGADAADAHGHQAYAQKALLARANPRPGGGGSHAACLPSAVEAMRPQ